jgi:hypothetical protein
MIEREINQSSTLSIFVILRINIDLFMLKLKIRGIGLLDKEFCVGCESGMANFKQRLSWSTFCDLS